MAYALADFESDRADEMTVEEVIRLPVIEMDEDQHMDMLREDRADVSAEKGPKN